MELHAQPFRVFLILCFSLRTTCEREKDAECVKTPEFTIRRNFYVDEYELPLRIEYSQRVTHKLVSHILKILLQEALGYPDVELHDQGSDNIDGNVTSTLQKISSCKHPNECGKVGPRGPKVMINLEVWLVPGFNLEGWVATGEIEDCGPLGPIGRSGWYTADDTVRRFWEIGTVVDHWRAFTNPNIVARFDLLNDGSLEFATPSFQRTKYCNLEECGKDGVYRPKQCLEPNVRCATLLAEYPASIFRLIKHEIEDLKLLVNVAFVGESLVKIVENRTANDENTIFFQKKPMFYSKTKFTHISFPHCEDDTVTVCEFEVKQLEKVVWSKIKTNAPYAFHLLRAISFTQEGYLDLLTRYNQGKSRGLSIQQIACLWVKQKAVVWLKWIPAGTSNKATLYIGGIFPIHGIYLKEQGVIPAANMAATAINKNNSILEKYNLEILKQDGRCAADEVMKSFINYVRNNTYKTMVGILGPACSDTVEPVAGVAKHFNTIIISYSAEGALFSNREKYPYFFRTIPENNQFQYVYLKLFRKLGYTRVAALTEDGQKYAEYVSYLQDLMQKNDMTFIINRKFPRERTSLDMKPYLLDLKNKGAKIIIGEFFDYAARAVMCDAYELGMTAANGYVWFLPRFTPSWFDTDSHNSMATDVADHIRCSTQQMVEVINGHMSLAYKFYADNDEIMQEGKTVGEWYSDYKSLTEKQKMEASRYGGYAYDAVWVYAKALDALLKENNSHVATLHSSKTSKRLVELLNETNFNGVTGSLFFLGSSRISNIIIWQWIKNTSRKIGVYRPSSQDEGVLDLNESSIAWLTPGGLKPDDGSSDYSSCPVEAFRSLLNVSCELAIVIINIIGLSTFAVIISVGFLFYKRHYEKRMKKTEERMKELGLLVNTCPFALDEWEMPRDHLVLNRKLGEGAFGTVYGGEAYVMNEGWIQVAVKTLKTGAKQEEKLDFLSEAEIMKKLCHVNIVQLVGVCTMSEPLYNVMEFMLYGDLKTFLLSRRNLAAEKDRTKNDEVSDKRLTTMALDIARGLNYLADLKYVHRDLACRNCLVNDSRTVKIADFGMCRAMYDSDYYRYNKKGMLPIRWMAPESLIDGLFTPMSDIWSFGVVIYEIVTFASFPYQGLSNNEVLEHIKNYNRLPVPKGCKLALEVLMLKCWSRCSKTRPQASEIVDILEKNPELITPCLDVPMSSVEVDDSGALEINIHDRSRGHSFSAGWLHRRTAASVDLTTTGFLELTQLAQNGIENGILPRHNGLTFAGRKKPKYETLVNKSCQKEFKDCYNKEISQITYL